jgi:AsmA protein
VRIARIVLGALGALVALLAVAVAIFASTFDPNEYKGVATEAFAARTGRALTIDEDLRLAYFPWLAVETGGVTIGSAPQFGGAAEPFATARRVAARVKLLPLLSRRVEIGTVELDGLTLNLARDAERRGNWQDLLEAANAPPTAPAEPDAAPAPRELAIEGVRITDGSVQWRENTAELRYSVTNLSLTTSGVGGGEPVSFDAALDFADVASGLRAAVAASAVVAPAPNGAVAATSVETAVTVSSGNGAPQRTLEATAERIAFDREAETLTVEGLVTEIAGIRAAWQVAGTSLLENPRLRGSVRVDPAELAAVFEQLRLSPPASIDARDLGTVALTAQFSFQAEPQAVQLSEVAAEVLGMRVTGEGSLTGGNELAGRVVVAEFTPNAALQALLRAAVPPTVDVAALGTLGLDSRFDTNLETGRAALRDFTLTALGAKVSGTLEGLPGERGNVFRGSLRTSRFSAAPMAKAFAALLPPNLAASELGMIELDTRFELDAATDTLTVPQLRAEAFGLRASGEVTARNISRAAIWTGTASVAQFSPQDLLQRFGLPPQSTSDPQAFRRATVNSRFTITKDGAELDDLVLALDETTIKGKFALQGFDAPAYRFTLDVDRVDADRYLPPKARDAQAGERTAGDIELPQNNTMNLDGTMNVGALKLAGMQFTDVGSRIFIGNGDMKLENARARLYGGSFAGNFHVRAAGNDPGLALDGRATGLQLEPLIAALTGEQPNFSGTGSFDLNLAGKGRTIIENVQTAGGNVSFDMLAGAIKGFNLGRTLCAAYNVTQREPGPPQLPAVTEYEAIKGSAVVTAGTATSNDLLARTSFMDINGAGSLRLAEQQLDYELDAKLTGPIKIENCQTLDEFVGGELPFRIKGTVLDPTITPDFSKLIRRQLREGLQDRLEDRLKDRLRDLLR